MCTVLYIGVAAILTELVPYQQINIDAPLAKAVQPGRSALGARWGALLPLRVLAELVNIGTLLAFMIVCAAVLIMRRVDPFMPRPFRCPSCRSFRCSVSRSAYCFSLPGDNWLRLIIWLLVSFAVTSPMEDITACVLARMRSESGK